MGLLNVLDDAIAEVAQLATVRDFGRIGAFHVDLARLFHDYFGGKVLLWWGILGMEWTHRSHHTMLGAHIFLVAILCISDFKVVENFLLNCDFVTAFSCLDLLSSDLQIDLRTKRSKVLIESLFTTQRMVWIKHIEGLTVDLVATGDHLRDGRHLWVPLLWHKVLSRCIRLRSNPLRSTVVEVDRGLSRCSDLTDA